MQTLNNIPTRFFTYGNIRGQVDIIETSESNFIAMADAYPESIQYERHTVSQNGVNQICLTVGSPDDF